MNTRKALQITAVSIGANALLLVLILVLSSQRSWLRFQDWPAGPRSGTSKVEIEGDGATSRAPNPRTLAGRGANILRLGVIPPFLAPGLLGPGGGAVPGSGGGGGALTLGRSGRPGGTGAPPAGGKGPGGGGGRDGAQPPAGGPGTGSPPAPGSGGLPAFPGLPGPGGGGSGGGGSNSGGSGSESPSLVPGLGQEPIFPAKPGKHGKQDKHHGKRTRRLSSKDQRSNRGHKGGRQGPPARTMSPGSTRRRHVSTAPGRARRQGAARRMSTAPVAPRRQPIRRTYRPPASRGPAHGRKHYSPPPRAARPAPRATPRPGKAGRHFPPGGNHGQGKHGGGQRGAAPRGQARGQGRGRGRH